MRLTSPRTRAWRRAQNLRYASKRLKQVSYSRQQKDINHHWHDDFPYPESGRLAKAKITCVRYGHQPLYKPSKRWYLLPTRSAKLLRAKRLKTFYPRKVWELELVDIQ